MTDKTEVNAEQKPYTVSVDTLAIERKLETVAISERISWKELSEIIKDDVQTTGRNHVESARRRLLRDKKVVFRAIAGFGLERIDGNDVVVFGGTYLDKSRRAAGQCGKIVLAADVTKLSKAEHTRANTLLSMAATVKTFARESTVRRLEQHVEKKAAQLSIGETLTAFEK